MLIYIINKVQWNSSDGNFTNDTSAIKHSNRLQNYLSKFLSNVSGAYELIGGWCQVSPNLHTIYLVAAKQTWCGLSYFEILRWFLPRIRIQWYQNNFKLNEIILIHIENTTVVCRMCTPQSLLHDQKHDSCNCVWTSLMPNCVYDFTTSEYNAFLSTT